MLSHCQEVFVDFCKQNQHRYFVEPNVPISMLERYEELEVRASKYSDVNVSPKMTFTTGMVPPTPELVIAITNIIHNVVVYNKCPLQAWNGQGLFRLLFRCSYWGDPTLYESACVRESVCRALTRSAANKHIRNTLAGTKDCLHSLFSSLHPTDLIQYNTKCQDAICQALLLLGSLLLSTKASEHVWCELKDGRAKGFFSLILQCLQTDNIELKKAAMYCLSQLIKTINQTDLSVSTYDISLIDFFDNIEAINEYAKDCCPGYMSEELCRVLMHLYSTFTRDAINTEFGQDEYWQNISSALSSLLSVSSRARQYAVHCGLQQSLLTTLVGIRDHLSFVGKPTQVIRNANSYPTLTTLHYTLTAINCMMTNCIEAKESFADNNISNSLNRLWPWCMMNEPLREAVAHLLYTFTNSCPKGWSAMCSCISGHCLITELCALVTREASLQSRPHCPDLLVLALNTLAQCMPHSHARPLILKSEVLTCIYKITVSERGRMGPASSAWARLAARVAFYADGAAKVLAMKPLPASVLILPAIANASHHHRVTILSTPELLDMLTAALLNNDTSQVVTAGRAVWALVANNHKAKLALRSAGIPAALNSALERMKHTKSDSSIEEALQLLTYTNTLLRDI